MAKKDTRIDISDIDAKIGIVYSLFLIIILLLFIAFRLQ